MPGDALYGENPGTQAIGRFVGRFSFNSVLVGSFAAMAFLIGGDRRLRRPRVRRGAADTGDRDSAPERCSRSGAKPGGAPNEEFRHGGRSDVYSP
jgi:hypothetical protein